MITVHVKLFATLREYRPGLRMGEAFPVALPDRATVGDLVQQLGLPRDEVRTVFVNARIRELDHPLADGDELGMFPSIGGG